MVKEPKAPVEKRSADLGRENEERASVRDQCGFKEHSSTFRSEQVNPLRSLLNDEGMTYRIDV
jgi:hypothetical protein